MSSEHPHRAWKNVATIALFGAAVGVTVLACVSIDKYAPPPRSDGGGVADSSSDVTLPDAAIEACANCLEAQCGSPWAACEAESDCQSCMFDSLGEGCTRSTNRRPLRNCGCVTSTCYKECPTLCTVPPPTGVISGVCIGCNTMKCPEFVSACVADSVCFACITDAANPKCKANKAWHDTTICLCGTRDHCFDECECQPDTQEP